MKRQGLAPDLPALSGIHRLAVFAFPHPRISISRGGLHDYGTPCSLGKVRSETRSVGRNRSLSLQAPSIVQRCDSAMILVQIVRLINRRQTTCRLLPSSLHSINRQQGHCHALKRPVLSSAALVRYFGSTCMRLTLGNSR